jgi:hypothetical protein
MLNPESQAMQRLQGANPFPAPDYAPDPPDVGVFLERLAPNSRPRYRHPPWRRVSVVAIVATAALAGLLLSTRGGSSDAEAAAKVLLRTASNVSGGSATLGTGEYYYTRVVIAFPSATKANCLIIRHGLQESWVARNETGWVRGAIAPAKFSSAAERTRCLKSGVPGEFAGRHFNGPLESGTEPILGPPTISYNAFRALPLNRAALSRAVARFAAADNQGGQATPVATLVAVSDLLEAWPGPPALRALLFRVAAETPGLHLVGPTRDATGRQGIAVEARLAAGQASYAVQLVVDPKTGELLERRLVTTRVGASTVESTTWTRAAVVSSAPNN